MTQLTVLLKTITKQFYIRHSGFFLLVLFFGAGFLSGREHMAIALALVHSLWLTSALLILWSLYVWMTINACARTFFLPENLFLRNLIFLPGKIRLKLLSTMQFSLNLPIVAYGAFLLTYGIYNNQWAEVWLIFCYLLLTSILPALFYDRMLLKSVDPKSTGTVMKWLHRKITKPFWLWNIQYLIYTYALAYLLTKALSLGILKTFFLIDDTEIYDWRWLAIGMLTAVHLNVILIFNLASFNHQAISWHRNMPSSSFNRLFVTAITILMLLIPEIVFTLKYFPNGRGLYLPGQLLCYGFSIAVAMFSLFQLFASTVQLSIKISFYAFTVMLLLSLFGFPIWALAILLLAFSGVTQINYYRMIPTA